MASDTIHLSQKQRKILTRVCKSDQRKGESWRKQIGSSLCSSIQQVIFSLLMTYTWHWVCGAVCGLHGYAARAVLDLGSDGIRTRHHCWVLCIHLLIILELLGYFADKDDMKWCFSSSFSPFSPFPSPSFWIPLVNWICRRGDKSIQCVWWVQTAPQWHWDIFTFCNGEVSGSGSEKSFFLTHSDVPFQNMTCETAASISKILQGRRKYVKIEEDRYLWFLLCCTFRPTQTGLQGYLCSCIPGLVSICIALGNQYNNQYFCQLRIFFS